MRRRGGVGMVLGVVVALSACGDAGPVGVRDVGTVEREIDVLGGTRSYRLYVPEAFDASSAAPLLIVFHGATQGAAGIELMSWFYPTADDHGLIVAFPEAAGDYWNTPNSPPAYWEVPDVAFTDALIDDVSGEYVVDRSRVYVAGYSNGAIFAQLYACLRGDGVAGLAVVGAGISASLSSDCPWKRPVATTVFFGDSDPQFFWDDGLAAGVGMLGGPSSAEWLATTNGCSGTADVFDVGADIDTDDGTEVELWRYVDCTPGASVDFYRIVHGGHTWPGSPLNLGPGFGNKTRRLGASETMVDFFLDHSLPSAR